MYLVAAGVLLAQLGGLWQVASVVAGLTAAWGAVRLARLSLVVDRSGLVVRNPVRTYRVPLDGKATFFTDGFGEIAVGQTGISLTTRGRRIRVFATEYLSTVERSELERILESAYILQRA